MLPPIEVDCPTFRPVTTCSPLAYTDKRSNDFGTYLKRTPAVVAFILLLGKGMLLRVISKPPMVVILLIVASARIYFVLYPVLKLKAVTLGISTSFVKCSSVV